MSDFVFAKQAPSSSKKSGSHENMRTYDHDNGVNQIKFCDHDGVILATYQVDQSKCTHCQSSTLQM